ncbi:MAG: transcription termination factor NusA [Candidatus Moraniibacteriota bacterium]
MPRKMKLEDDKQPAGESFSARLGEFGSAVLQLADEKGIARETVIGVVEAALAAAYKKDYGKRGQNIHAQFDEVSKASKYFLVKEVVDTTTRDFSQPSEEEEVVEPKRFERQSREMNEPMDGEEVRIPRFNPERDILLEDAQQIRRDASVGETVELPLEAHDEFGRVAAQTAKQVIIQRIREAEREAMFSEYKSREGEIINGTVERVDGRLVFVNIGKSVGVMFPSEQVEGERYIVGQRIKVFMMRVDADPKGPGIVLSRAHAAMVEHLFKLEVPEINAGTVEVKAIAREAGSRTKIAVWSDEEGVDPIGSCVGQKGTRVQAVIDELHGEKIDIIQWNPDTEAFIRAALAPAKVVAVTLNEEEHVAQVTVPEDQLSLAIGRRGQNVRLASKLTGFRIDVSGAVVPEIDEEAIEKTSETLGEIIEATEVELKSENQELEKEAEEIVEKAEEMTEGAQPKKKVAAKKVTKKATVKKTAAKKKKAA